MPISDEIAVKLVADVEELLYGVRLKSVLGGDNIFFGLTDLIFNQFLVEKHAGGSGDGHNNNHPNQNGKNAGRMFGINHPNARIDGFFRNERRLKLWFHNLNNYTTNKNKKLQKLCTNQN